MAAEFRTFGYPTNAKISSDIPCSFFDAGKCRKGDRCRFRHGDPVERVADVGRDRIAHCTNYRFGTAECDRGRYCRYKHEQIDIGELYLKHAEHDIDLCLTYIYGDTCVNNPCFFDHIKVDDAVAGIAIARKLVKPLAGG